MQSHKTCSKCGEAKPLEGFHKNPTGKYGYREACRECVNRQASEYQKRNRAAHNDRSSRWVQRNPESRKKSVNSYYERNKEVINRSNSERRTQSYKLSQSLAQPGRPRWRAEEEQFILEDNGMTMYQKAIELSRTLSACWNKKYALEKERNNAAQRVSDVA